MLKIYPSTSTTYLFERFEQDLCALYQAPEQHIFNSISVLVQSPAMEKWLQINIAKRHGVIGNIKFPMPATFIWQLYTQLLDKSALENSDRYSKSVLSWRLMKIINDDFSTLPQAVRTYLGSPAQDSQNMQHFQFCAAMADVYDQYLVFRPEWIKTWEGNSSAKQSHNTVNHFIASHWQGELWRLLIQDDCSDTPRAHRSHFNHLTLELLSSATDIPLLTDSQGLKQLFVFGLSSLPQQHLELLQTLAQHIDVHFYLQVPSLHYYGDIQSRKKQAWIQSHAFKQGTALEDLHLSEGNPLLAAMGASAKQFMDQLLMLGVDPDIDSDALFEEQPEESHFLAHSQFEIRQLSFSGDLNVNNTVQKDLSANFSLSADDDSIRIHDCHSRFRELQVLHNQLLYFFEQDPSLQPQDIIILAPNPNDYAPYIKSIFGHDTQHSSYLPYALNESNILLESPLVHSFFELLSVSQQRYKASLISNLLKQPAIYSRWAFNQQERQQIFQWIQNLGVHWAWDGQEKQRWELPSSEKYTWQNAIQRSLLGLLIDEDVGVFEQAKNPNIALNWQSQEHAALLGRYFDFLYKIYDIQQSLDTAQSIEQWFEFLSQLLKDFYAAQDSRESSELLAIQQCLVKLKTDVQLAQHTQAIDLNVIVSILQENLAQPQQSFQLISGKINVASLLPMRGIEFRVVCLLGMNDGEYPHPDSKVEFNLMDHQARKLGDRSRREEDAYQFLQALISAQDKLHISYIGRSVQDNSKLNPSAFVQELLYYCTHTAYVENSAQSNTDKNTSPTVEDMLVIEHPLFAFNPQYFLASNQNKSLINYSQSDFLCAAQAQRKEFMWYQQIVNDTSAAATDEANNVEKDTAIAKVNLDELIYFYKNPAQHYCQQQGIYFEQFEDFIEDQEPLDFEVGLPRYIYFKQAIEAIKNGLSLAQWQTSIEYSGDTPDTKQAELASREMWSKAEHTLKLAQGCLSSELPLDEFNLHQKNYRSTFNSERFEFNSQINLLEENKNFDFKNNVNSKDIIVLWLKHLAANSQSLNVESKFFAPDQNASKNTPSFNAVDASCAQQHLSLFINHYLNSQQQLLPFDVNLSSAYAQSLYKDGDQQQALVKSLNALETARDSYTKLVFNEPMINSENFTMLAEQLLIPMYQQLSTVKSDLKSAEDNKPNEDRK